MKIFRFFFCVIVFFLILLSVFTSDFKSKVSEREKRKLAPFPELKSEGKLNKNFFNEMNLYLEDRIGLKFQYKKLHEKLNDVYQVENDADKSGFIGKDGWLFANGDRLLENWQKTNRYTEEELSYYCSKIKNMKSWCEKRGIKFIFYVAPNKYEIYGEFYPFQPRPQGETLCEQIVSRLKNEGVDVIYPRDFLLEKKRTEPFPIYYERDTHWNKLGAYYGSLSIVSRIKDFFPGCALPSISYDFEKCDVPNGDLEPLIGTSSRLMTDYKVRATVDGKELTGLFQQENPQNDPKFFATRADERFPRLVMFRDSFGNSLYPYLAPYFSRGEYWWRFPAESDKPYLRSFKPDLVIFEVVERHMQYVYTLTEFSDD